MEIGFVSPKNALFNDCSPWGRDEIFENARYMIYALLEIAVFAIYRFGF